jgi:hypothetical protein
LLSKIKDSNFTTKLSIIRTYTQEKNAWYLFVAKRYHLFLRSSSMGCVITLKKITQTLILLQKLLILVALLFLLVVSWMRQRFRGLAQLLSVGLPPQEAVPFTPQNLAWSHRPLSYSSPFGSSIT